ncbi:leucine-rich repeat containing protein [Dorcoceras hygrometricum]|uniref:Leucine-rich repeat containing protein n=1 Tax=Dorcoceras hygrometricum TaxID=472368 RepID=A0A2Z7BCA5_9LAMI|nr:leucine-rich repeat containing protein [Dorcoceras hygrometricum]
MPRAARLRITARRVCAWVATLCERACSISDWRLNGLAACATCSAMGARVLRDERSDTRLDMHDSRATSSAIVETCTRRFPGSGAAARPLVCPYQLDSNLLPISEKTLHLSCSPRWSASEFFWINAELRQCANTARTFSCPLGSIEAYRVLPTYGFFLIYIYGGLLKLVQSLIGTARRSAAGSLVGVFYATPFHLVGTLRFGVARAISSKNPCYSLTLISRWFERSADGSSADLRYATSFGLVAATPFWVVFKGVRYCCCWKQQLDIFD